MLVKRGEITEGERQAFERAVLSCGRRLDEFRLMVFTASHAASLRSVHVASRGAAAQYEAGDGRVWTQRFAEHLANGRFR